MASYIPPETWSQHPGNYAAMLGEDTSTYMDGWVIHWPGSSRGPYTDPTLAQSIARLQGYETYHLSKEWRGLAYDYAVDMNGRLFRVRGTGGSAATSGDYDEDGVPNNRETDAVLLIVGPVDAPSPAMLAALVDLVDDLGGPRRYVIGHRQARGTSTSCPGPRVMATVIDPIQRDGWSALSTVGPAVPGTYTVVSGDTLSKIAGRFGTTVARLVAANSIADPNLIRVGETLKIPKSPKSPQAPTAPKSPQAPKSPTKPARSWQEEVIDKMQTVDLRDADKTLVKGADVGRLQALLAAAGFPPENSFDSKGRPDGQGGAGTKAALGALQKRHPKTGTGGHPDYQAGPKVWTYLLAA